MIFKEFKNLMVSIGLVWLLIVAREFSFSFIGNEVDVLPSARQYIEPYWLSNDWYLNLDIGYRHLFNRIFGTLVSWLGFEYGSYLGRLLVYLLLAIAITFFFKSLRLRLSFGLLFLVPFLNRQSLIAGEWMVGGVDTKTISYAFVILSLSFFLRKRYLMGFAFAGAAMSFHVLVGLYALFCILVATLLNQHWRSEWRLYIYRSWPFLITGIFGLQAIVKQLSSDSNLDTTRAWEIYVQFRVPHHLLPTAWNGNIWIAKLVLATSLFLIAYLIGKSNATRFVAAYALGSISLFLVGLAISRWGDISLLKYYWFRFPDVMAPFISVVLIALFLSDISRGRFIIPTLPKKLKSKLQTTMSRVAPKFSLLAVTIIIFYSLYQKVEELSRPKYQAQSMLPALEWISKNTPKQAIFLVDPTVQNFYIYAQRAVFVSFKHSPQSATNILEWYDRIKLSNGNLSLDESGFNSYDDLRTNFYNLDEDQIRQIASSYGISYYLGVPQQNLTFERVYSDSYFTVYKINHTDNAKMSYRSDTWVPQNMDSPSVES